MPLGVPSNERKRFKIHRAQDIRTIYSCDDCTFICTPGPEPVSGLNGRPHWCKHSQNEGVTGEWHEPFRALPLLFRCTDARADSSTHMPCHPCRLQRLRQRHYQGSMITSDLPSSVLNLTLSVGSDKLIEFGALVENNPLIRVIVITGDQKKND